VSPPRTQTEGRFGRLLGASGPMLRIYRLLAKVAANDLPVLITGESGTGKELVARELHDRGARRDGPFVTVNCAAITETLFESELFGHERGAFTGASAQKRGRIEAADSGTLFFDEIGEIPPQTQVKLLRFLQEREFERVGGNRALRVDVRIVAATNRDLAQAMRTGLFREDLFYRLNVIPVSLPPLRERGEDAALLAEHFAREVSVETGREKRLSAAALEAVRSYPWPGNVRELWNAVERAHVLADGEQIEVGDLPSEIRAASRSRELEDLHLGRRLAALERELIARALARAGGDPARAAAWLGLDAGTLARKRGEHGL
jgi:DNA-binding NtrC family response regulator